jgi:hypothetical protein
MTEHRTGTRVHNVERQSRKGGQLIVDGLARTRKSSRAS